MRQAWGAKHSLQASESPSVGMIVSVGVGDDVGKGEGVSAKVSVGAVPVVKLTRTP